MAQTPLTPGTVPQQPVAQSPMKKRAPMLWLLLAVIVLIGVANLGSLVGRKGKVAPKSTMTAQPATVSPQQVRSYQTMQATEAKQDAAMEQQNQQRNLLGQQQGSSDVPSPEADSVAPMTAAQREAIYGSSPNAPQATSGASQAHAEAAERELARQKLHQDALNADTVAIDFSTPSADKPSTSQTDAAPEAQATPATLQHVAEKKVDPASKADPLGAYPFDAYQGQLYRVFEGTVLEGVVTNHIDGAFSGPIILMLTTDYYSHDHQQLLMPQGTRLIGSVQSVGSQGQRKLMVSFTRAVCPDGFSIDFDKYIGLDPIGTTGIAGKVNNHILSSFAAAAAIGGLGGLAQVGNSASILSPSTQIRDSISSQTSQESEQILNHFLNRLPVITLKEGSRARVYIGTDILIPSYAAHRVDPTL